MVDNTKTDITFVLDRSGSMSAIQDEAIGGFNRLLEDQRELAAKTLSASAQAAGAVTYTVADHAAQKAAGAIWGGVA